MRNVPTILTLFGATGDLAQRKIYPSIFRLFINGQLPLLFKLIGFVRRDMSEAEFRDLVRQSLQKEKATKKQIEAFLLRVTNHVAPFEHLDGYRDLASKLGVMDGEWRACANKLFYLAIPPDLIETVINRLHDSHLTDAHSDKEGWTRVMIEKPIGNDFESATHIDKLFGKLFSEEQIYRIDHYLGKEMVMDVLALRFANHLFSKSWTGEFIDSIEVYLWEKLGIEDRGAFYDDVGALRDVGQNHLLQLVALATMEEPGGFSPKELRGARSKALQALVPPTDAEHAIRAQYKGYKQAKGVAADSKTETFFRVETRLKKKGWHDVPIVLESGKCMPSARKEIIVNFRHPDPCVCPDEQPEVTNTLTIAFEPKPKLELCLWLKKPGYEYELEARTIDLLSNREGVEQIEAYEKLILDCIHGDQTLFVSTEELAAMWKFTDSVRDLWSESDAPLASYEPGISFA